MVNDLEGRLNTKCKQRTRKNKIAEQEKQEKNKISKQGNKKQKNRTAEQEKQDLTDAKR